MKSDFIVLSKTTFSLVTMANDITQQTLLPNFIAFALVEERKGFHDTTLTSPEIMNETINAIAKLLDGTIEFTVTRILDTVCDYKCIDICVKKCKGDYYSVIFADKRLPDYFNFQLDTIVANNKTYMIRPQEGLHGLVVYRKLHKHLGGSTSFNENNEPYLEKITDKILNYAKEEMIYEWQN